MKTTKWLTLVCTLLLLAKSYGQPSPCPCAENQVRPLMVLSDDHQVLKRMANFVLRKAKHLEKGFPQELPLDLSDLKNLFAQSNNTSDKVSGIRIYFAQTQPKQLSLIFVTTRYINKLDIDNENEYMLLTSDFSSPKLKSITKSEMEKYTQDYRQGFVADQGSLPPIGSAAVAETLSLFYSSEMIRQMYSALTGCLKDVIKGVAVKFVAYAPGEYVEWDAIHQTKRVDNKLTLHFSFKGADELPFNFNSCTWQKKDFRIKKKHGGDTDTALPCPDFCPAETVH